MPSSHNWHEGWNETGLPWQLHHLSFVVVVVVVDANTPLVLQRREWYEPVLVVPELCPYWSTRYFDSTTAAVAAAAGVVVVVGVVVGDIANRSCRGRVEQMYLRSRMVVRSRGIHSQP